VVSVHSLAGSHLVTRGDVTRQCGRTSLSRGTDGAICGKDYHERGGHLWSMGLSWRPAASGTDPPLLAGQPSTSLAKARMAPSIKNLDRLVVGWISLGGLDLVTPPDLTDERF